MKTINRFFGLTISDKNMSKVMYALLKTRTKLINSYSPSIAQYTRKQSGGFYVQICVEVEENKVEQFEEIAEVKLQTSEEFQGKLQVNNTKEIDYNKIIERSKRMEDTLLEIRSQFSDTNRFQALTLQIDKILKE